MTHKPTSQEKKKCYHCKYRGDIYRPSKDMPQEIPHCHCEHPGVPDKEKGWGTWMSIFDSCKKFKPKSNSDLEELREQLLNKL